MFFNTGNSKAIDIIQDVCSKIKHFHKISVIIHKANFLFLPSAEAK